MRITKWMVELELARTGGEASRLVKQGAVSIGGCSPECSWFDTGKCNCGGWTKVRDGFEEIESGLAIKIGTGHWRLLPRLDGNQGWDQVRGIGRVI